MADQTYETSNGAKRKLKDMGDGTQAEVVVTQDAGSTGVDFSVNQPTLPNIGANFSASGPYASWVLVKTIPANAARKSIEIINLTASDIAIIRDDGTASSGSAPANASSFSLAPGGGAGFQGGAWSSTTFKGRLQIYAAVALSGNATISVMED